MPDPSRPLINQNTEVFKQLDSLSALQQNVISSTFDTLFVAYPILKQMDINGKKIFCQASKISKILYEYHMSENYLNNKLSPSSDKHTKSKKTTYKIWFEISHLDVRRKKPINKALCNWPLYNNTWSYNSLLTTENSSSQRYKNLSVRQNLHLTSSLEHHLKTKYNIKSNHQKQYNLFVIVSMPYGKNISTISIAHWKPWTPK